MVPEDLLFWISPLNDAPTLDPNVLCRRHADAMVVPRGWTLDDLREEVPRLFRPAGADSPDAPRRTRSRRPASAAGDEPEQLQIDGTGETPRPVLPDADGPTVPAATDAGESATPWEPTFDHDNDLDGLLEVKSPLLARAFRGTDRPRS